MAKSNKSVYSLIIAVFISSIFVAVQAQDRRCFQFTWLGPRYNNESLFLNATCADATRLSGGVPCFEPLVASYDGSWPNVEYIWQNHREQASCLLADNDVCAQYTYFFNGIAENSTYMCTRAVDSMDQAVTSGCYHQVNGSWSTRLCVCRSIPGGVPCNSTTSLLPTIVFSLVCLLALVCGRK